MSDTFHNTDLLADDAAREALRELVDICRKFAAALPESEPAQAVELQRIIETAGAEVRQGTLKLCPDAALADPVIRLYKAPLTRGRLKLQLFPLARGEAHPPHAHHDLLSCQLVLAGAARIREYSLLGRPDPGSVEIREEGARTLAPGDGVFTLQYRNNIHWQEGLTDGTVLLNINWQGCLPETGAPPAQSAFGRRYLDWDARRPGRTRDRLIVPERTAT
ncbi:MAG: hypothetical protein ACR2PO_15535 [Methyloligellaceae bacterium]